MLELKNVSVIFNKDSIDEKKAINDLSLHVKRGDFITIIGSNGAGKSTLFNVISGTIETESGSIVMDHKDITFMPEHKRSKDIGRLFQDPLKGTAPNMTIEENLALSSGKGGWLSIISRKEKDLYRSKVSSLGMGLEDNMNQPMGSLSGGQRQSIALLMATINPPKILLLDEHTAALDPEAQSKVLSITESIIRENNLTCLMITHDMEMALSFGNRTIMMKDGKIVLDIEGEERRNTTVNDLLKRFRMATGESLNTDEILL